MPGGATMLPIVQFPRIVEQQAAWFDPVFSPDEQRKHFVNT
jgi:hypothetical protein